MRYLLTWVVALALAHGIAALISREPLVSLVGDAEAVVIGEATDFQELSAEYETRITVNRSLKGTLQPGVTVNARFVIDGPGIRPSRTTVARGIFFLVEESPGRWRLLFSDKLRSFFIPSREQITTPVGTTVDQIVALFAAAVEHQHSDAGPGEVFLALAPRSSPVVQTMLEKWSSSAAPRLRFVGVAGLLSASDASALTKIVDDLESLGSSPYGGLIASKLGAVRDMRPSSVIALGRIATSEVVPESFRDEAAFALAAIHTAESLPFLDVLLRSPRPLRRSVAVAGFSAFALNVRVAKPGPDSAEALDEVLNPGRRLTQSSAPFDNEQTRRFAHFGPFKDGTDDAEFTSFWAGWYAGHFSPEKK